MSIGNMTPSTTAARVDGKSRSLASIGVLIVLGDLGSGNSHKKPAFMYRNKGSLQEQIYAPRNRKNSGESPNNPGFTKGCLGVPWHGSVGLDIKTWESWPTCPCRVSKMWGPCQCLV